MYTRDVCRRISHNRDDYNRDDHNRDDHKWDVIIVDDDLLTRRGVLNVLGDHRSVGRRQASTLDEALAFDASFWRRFDVVVIDVHDQVKEAREVGTDVYSGVSIMESIRRWGLDLRIVAITPTRRDPLLSERLRRGGADFVHERVDFQRPSDVVDAAFHPSDRHRPAIHAPWVLLEEGLGHCADPNRAVAVYKASPLYGRVRPGVTQAAIGPRRAALKLRDDIIGTGFIGRGHRARWNEVRDYLLKLTGRLPVAPRDPGPAASGPRAMAP